MESFEPTMAADGSRAADNTPISRRRLLYLAGAGTAATLLTACTSSTADDDIAGSDSTETDSTTSGSTESESTASESTASESGTTDSAGSSPDCVLTPEDAEGPFYADLDLDREDITDGKPGAPLELQLTVVDAATCAPITNAVVDVWHADAIGQYSAFPGQGDERDVDTSAETFLRGFRTTDADGLVTFRTIYPGWYPGRTTHIHLKVHLDDQTLVTSQLYFPDGVTNEVYVEHPAYEERGEKDTSNDADGLNADDVSLLMTVAATADGYRASHTVGISRS